MTDEELIYVCTEFRSGLLNNSDSTSMCAVVSWAIQGYLSSVCNVNIECFTTDLSDNTNTDAANHVWLLLPDGRVLDPTYDQFGGDPIYLGAPTEYHINTEAA